MMNPVHLTAKPGDYESAIIPGDDHPFQSAAFLPRVYSTLILQLLITIALTLLVSVPPISDFVTSFAVNVTTAVVLFIGIGLLYQYRKQSPVNYVLLCLCTLGASYLVALPCSGQMFGLNIFMESWGLTITVLASLSFYSLKAARKGLDFSFMNLYLLKAAIALMLLLFLLILFPQGRSVFFFCHLILAGFGSTVYGSYIVYLTHDLVTRFPYEEHIWASLSLYIYTIALFLFFFLLITC